MLDSKIVIKRLLILGGTKEARLLADRAFSQFNKNLFVLTSLAGTTKNPARISGSLRLGGFGGTSGLKKFLHENSFDFLIDATHPFASRISLHAEKACNDLKVKRLILKRPAWKVEPKDKWVTVGNLRAAARLLPSFGRICFLSVGTKSLEPFSKISNIYFVVRTMESPETPLPLIKYEIIMSRPPFESNQDTLLMKKKGIDIIVAKNSGGDSAYSKIIAARKLAIPVIMIDRPSGPSGQIAETVSEAISWLENKGVR